MARSGSLAATLFVLLLAACAGSPYKTKAPSGLAFDCMPGGAAFLTFNDGGYLPDSNAVARLRDGGTQQAPRSAAMLEMGGARHALVAEWAEQGLRYRATATESDGRHLIVSLRGEAAMIGRRAETAAEGEAGEGEVFAACRRAGRGASAAPASEGHDAAHDGEAGHAAEGEPPHRR